MKNQFKVAKICLAIIAGLSFSGLMSMSKSELLQSSNIVDLLSCAIMQKAQCVEEQENRSETPGETIVVFDLDGVTMIPKVVLGNDKWAYYVWGRYFDECLKELTKNIAKDAETDVVEKAKKDADAQAWQWYRGIWPLVQNNVEVRLVEDKFMDVIETLAKNGIKMMGFTARGMNLVDRTKVQLDSLKRDKGDSVGSIFAKNAYSQDFIQTSDYVNKDGVLFINMSVNKGETIKKFFERIGKKPGKIVFVDDTEKNIKTMQGMCAKENIDYVGIFYHGADEIVKLDDKKKKISDVQLDQLIKNGKVLTDEQAWELAKNS